jgi:glycosyltransferase involved in cell wall biosynthesis
MTITAAVDVIIPVYNAASTLDETLESIAAQTLKEFRVISIDDGSTDGSADILADWARGDSRFSYHSQTNSGIVDTLNIALDKVEAPYVARMDADDLCDPTRFERQHAYLDEHKQAVAVGGRVRHIDEDGAIIEGFPHPGDPSLADAWSVPAKEPYIIHPFLMARTGALRAAGGYRHMPHSEDTDLFWRLQDLGMLHNLDEMIGGYRLHAGSISGASITNGRIMAVGSQLAAWAARKRQQGLKEALFSDDLIGQLKKAGRLQAMCDLAEAQCDMSADDAPLFRCATAIKLLELADYRPYEIDLEDASFITAAVSKRKSLGLTSRNLREIDWYLSVTARRLAMTGHTRTASALLPIRLWPMTALRALRRQPSSTGDAAKR